MKKTVLALAFLGILGAANVGCGGASCESICEDANACEGVTTPTDCTKSCADAKAIVDETGCSADYDKVVSCFGGVEDICAITLDTCSSENAAYAKCVVDFCTANPMAASCM